MKTVTLKGGSMMYQCTSRILFHVFVLTFAAGCSDRFFSPRLVSNSDLDQPNTSQPSEQSDLDISKDQKEVGIATGQRPQFPEGYEITVNGNKKTVKPLEVQEIEATASYMLLDVDSVYQHIKDFPDVYKPFVRFMKGMDSSGQNKYLEALRCVDYRELVRNATWIQERYGKCFVNKSPDNCLLFKTADTKDVEGRVTNVSYSDALEIDAITPESFARLATDLALRADALIQRDVRTAQWKTPEFAARNGGMLKPREATERDRRQAFVVISLNDGSLDPEHKELIQKYVLGEIPREKLPLNEQKRQWVNGFVHLKNVIDKDGNWLPHVKDMIQERHELIAIALNSGMIQPPALVPLVQYGNFPTKVYPPGIKPIMRQFGGWWVHYHLPKGLAEDFQKVIVNKDKKINEMTKVSVMTIRVTEDFVTKQVEASALEAGWQWNEDTRLHNPNLLRPAIRQYATDYMIALANAGLPEQMPQFPAFTFPAAQAPIPHDPVTGSGGLSVGGADRFFVESTDSYGVNFKSPIGGFNLTWKEVAVLSETWRRTFASSRVKDIDLKGTPNPVPALKELLGDNVLAVAQQVDQEKQSTLTISNGTQQIVEGKAIRALVIEHATVAPYAGSESWQVTAAEEKMIELFEIHDILIKDPKVPQEFKDRLAHFFTRPGETVADNSAYISDEGKKDYIATVFEIWNQIKQKPRTTSKDETFDDVYQRRFESRKDFLSAAKRQLSTVASLSVIIATGTVAEGFKSVQSHFRGTVELKPGVITEVETREELVASEDTQTNTRWNTQVGSSKVSSKTRERTFLKLKIDDTVYGVYHNQIPTEFSSWNLPWTRDENTTSEMGIIGGDSHPATLLASQRFGGINGYSAIDSQLAVERHPRKDKKYDPVNRRWFFFHSLLRGMHAPNYLYDWAVHQWRTGVRPRISFDEDFFNAPNIALVSDDHWSNPDRIREALQQTSLVKDPEDPSGRMIPVALLTMRRIVDSVGRELLPDGFVADNIAVGEKDPNGLKSIDLLGVGEGLRRKLNTLRARKLNHEEITLIRRDAALHWLVFREIIPISVLDAMSSYWGLGSYHRPREFAAPFDWYRTIIAVNPEFKDSQPENYEKARAEFTHALNVYGKTFSSKAQEVYFPYILVGEQILGD